MDVQCYIASLLLYALFALGFVLLVVSLLLSAIALFPSPPNKIEGIAEQIDRIGIEAKEELDRVSDKYMRQVYEQMNQGEK